MHKYSLIFATTLLAFGIATSADAMTISAPAGLRPATQETTTTQTIYWGWGYYRPVYVAPPVYVVPPIVVAPPVYAPLYWRPRYYARPIFWGGPRFYGRRFYGW